MPEALTCLGSPPLKKTWPQRHSMYARIRPKDKSELAMDALRCPPDDADVSVLSGGERRRVALCRLLLSRPDLLLLDEPLSALDKKLREEMQLEFRRIQQELEVTTINVTHDQREALTMSDRIVVMFRGRIMGEFYADEIENLETIGLLMAGVTDGVKALEN